MAGVKDTGTDMFDFIHIIKVGVAIFAFDSAVQPTDGTVCGLLPTVLGEYGAGLRAGQVVPIGLSQSTYGTRKSTFVFSRRDLLQDFT